MSLLLPAPDGFARLENLIDGKRCPALSLERLASVDPSIGETWAEIPSSGSDDIAAAVDAAKRAFSGAWSDLPALGRAGLLRNLAGLFADHASELARIESRDNGRALAETSAGDLPAVTQILHYFAGAADKLMGDTVQVSPASFNFTVVEAVGVVGIIIPWNAPLSILAAKVGAALAAGCTVVVKPAEQASCSILAAAELFEHAGFPPGVVNIVSGLGSTAGDSLVRHPDVRKISFTGSTATARRITAASADSLTQLAFELGGKSANIVFADADLDAAELGVSTASVFTGGAGQTCVAGSRILIERPIYEEMVERIARRASEVRIGDPMDLETQMGPIAFDRQYDKVRDYIALGSQEGAEIAFGGRSGEALMGAGSPHAGGYFVEPTFFRDARNDMRICREEIFGPVASAIPFDTEEEAVALANDSSYGLACGVWTSDLKRAHRAIAAVKTGVVWVNAYRRIHWALPFGGVKESGYGRDSGLESLRGYLHTKTAWIEL
ncbi:MAG: aldehyde dehydrogenase family protein [Myxococcales bacterium]|nr:aldehyde dehydrogenase family protein [Myxococcales bacterium]